MVIEVIIAVVFILGGLLLMGTYANKKVAFRQGKGRLITGVLLIICGIVGLYRTFRGQGGALDVLAEILAFVGRFFSELSDAFAKMT